MRVKIESLRACLADVLRGVGRNPVTVTRYGEEVAVIISTRDFAELNHLRGLYRKYSQHYSSQASVSNVIG